MKNKYCTAPNISAKNRERGAIYSVIASTFLNTLLSYKVINLDFSLSPVFFMTIELNTILTDKKKKNKDI